MYLYNAEQRQYIMYSFQTAQWDPVRAQEFPHLEPGQEIHEELRLAEETSWGFCQTWSQPPVLESSMRIDGFAGGTYRFHVVFHNNMGLYVGPTGVHDFQTQSRKIPQGLPGFAELGYDDVFDDTLDASAEASFS